jgi:hypothetical protein
VVAGWLGLALCSWGASAGYSSTSASDRAARVPIPTAGNVTVARLALVASTRGASALPRLTADRRGLPAGTLVAATVTRGIKAGAFLATVAVLRPTPPTGVTSATGSAGFATVRLPAGVKLAGAPQVAADVLYLNAPPSFAFLTGAGSVLAGKSPKLPPTRIVDDAQALAFDRTVSPVDMGLLRLAFVAAQFGPKSTTLRVTITLSQLTQVNAVELRLAAGTRVAKIGGPPGTDGLPVSNGIQLVASSGFFQAGVANAFTLRLSRAPRKGDALTVRASTHYFESALPFTERFVFG